MLVDRCPKYFVKKYILWEALFKKRFFTSFFYTKKNLDYFIPKFYLHLNPSFLFYWKFWKITKISMKDRALW